MSPIRNDDTLGTLLHRWFTPGLRTPEDEQDLEAIRKAYEAEHGSSKPKGEGEGPH